MSRSAQATLVTILFFAFLVSFSEMARGIVVGFGFVLAIGFIIWNIGGRPGTFFGGG